MKTLRAWTPFVLAAALGAMGVGVGAGVGVATDNAERAVAVEANASPDSSLTLRQDMRRLWSEHVFWTRVYLIAAAADAPDQKAASDRLMKNQEDLGDALAPYYGKTAAGKFTGLMKDHIGIAVDLIRAAKAGDKARAAEADKRWQDNAEQIAQFLSEANPHWLSSTLTEMMRDHLRSTTNEVNARLDKRWERDVAAFDEVYDHALKLSDTLSDGIIKQFPDRFDAGVKTGANTK
ncbi:hypothetical protein PHYC_01272 [Phycisphaerales bacterium]|nr:hypothetical protein PHYC_01272 [Phycisphaerales bacterium]